MRIGDYTLRALEAGRFGLDGGAMFGIVPRPLWSRRIEPDAEGRIPLATRCLLIEGPDRLVVVDAGIGDKVDARFREIYGIHPDGPDLAGPLAEAGFSPDDVTDVILTHLHFDHCGGMTRMDGDRSVPVFRRAVHHVQGAHWDWAASRPLRERASFLPENFHPVEAEGLLNRVDGAATILPGISVEPVHGHTEAQQLVHVEGGGEHLVFVADLIPTSAHVPPVWGMAYDIRPLVTIEEKTSFLGRAIEGRWILFFEHDASVQTGRIVAGDRGPELADRARLDER
jgi:glyoxylase-like metal-dependent hydrolase (beta-lactamase superfamily II)